METANDERNSNSVNATRTRGLLYPLIIPDVLPEQQKTVEKPGRIKFLSKFANKSVKANKNNVVPNKNLAPEKHHVRARSVSEDRNHRLSDWVCPNDRQLTLRAKLRIGWSVRAEMYEKYGPKPKPLTDKEQEIITSVIKRAEAMEKQEQERIGFLVERLDNMKKHALGTGTKHCVLCGEKFGFLGSSCMICFDCQKALCTKCGIETTVTKQKESVWLCKICAETREMWKKSGAWFYKSMPKYVLPKKSDMFPYSYRIGDPLRNKILDSGKEEDESSSEDDLRTTISAPARYTISEISNKSSPASPSSTKNMFSELSSSSLTPKVTKVPSCESNTSTGGKNQNLERSFRRNGSPESGCSRALSSESGGPVPQILVNHCDSVSLCNRDVSESQRRLIMFNHGNDEYVDDDLKSVHSISKSDSCMGTIELSIQYDLDASSLHVSLHRAKGLKGMDINGLSDPFCRMVLKRNSTKAYRVKTKTIEKTVNPEFNETKTFYGITDADMNQSLYIMILDDDKYGHDFLGEARFPLNRLKPGVTRDLCLNLEKHIPGNSEDEIYEEDVGSNGKIAFTLSYSTRKRSLIVGIMHCENLIPMDNNGLSDPFVKLYLRSPEGTQSGKCKTSIKWKNLNPIFNEDFSFETKITDLSRKSLVITVWDKDPGYRNNDFLGSLELGCHSKGDRLRQWIDMIKYPDHKHEGTHFLSKNRIKD